MEKIEIIEGYFKARCSFLVCKHSATQVATLTKSAYTALSQKFEKDLQHEIIFSLNKCEDKNVDLIMVLNRLLKISDDARLLFMQINQKSKKAELALPVNTNNYKYN